MKTSYRKNRRSGVKRRRGAMVALVAVMMVVVLGMAAFAVDVGWVVTNKTQLQSAADAAALAGASALVENFTLAGIQSEAMHYAQINAPQAAPTVDFGVWNPDTQTFTPDSDDPNAVRVLVERTAARGNAAPSFFGRVFGRDHFDIAAESVAVGAVRLDETIPYTMTVYVTSTKDLSNVVLRFVKSPENEEEDPDEDHQKFQGLSGYTGTFAGTGKHAGKAVKGVWIKSGTYQSGDGPGYGDYLEDPDDGSTVYGKFSNTGSYAKVSATFGAKGVTFVRSGSDGPVRLVK